MNESDRKVLEDIEHHGWHVVIVREDDMGPGFAFSIGLYHSFGHPEIIMLGLPGKTMHALINLMGEEVRDGKVYEGGGRYAGLIEGFDCFMLRMDRSLYHEYLGYALWFYKDREFPVLQCVWPDRSGNFPWNEDYAGKLRSQQPLLSK